jgi:hypothetical protein
MRLTCLNALASVQALNRMASLNLAIVSCSDTLDNTRQPKLDGLVRKG